MAGDSTARTTQTQRELVSEDGRVTLDVHVELRTELNAQLEAVALAFDADFRRRRLRGVHPPA